MVIILNSSFDCEFLKIQYLLSSNTYIIQRFKISEANEPIYKIVYKIYIPYPGQALEIGQDIHIYLLKHVVHILQRYDTWEEVVSDNFIELL